MVTLSPANTELHPSVETLSLEHTERWTTSLVIALSFQPHGPFVKPKEKLDLLQLCNIQRQRMSGHSGLNISADQREYLHYDTSLQRLRIDVCLLLGTSVCYNHRSEARKDFSSRSLIVHLQTQYSSSDHNAKVVHVDAVAVTR
jgi:hypothetical protein